MSESIITVENLSKRYLLGRQRAKGDGLRHAIENTVRHPLGWFKAGRLRRTEAQKEEFWALKDVSFGVKQGEVVGIVGRNGAGKSTLLKILSRITEPTSGRIRIKGRVASLLEVGTGFHPELTGRENIFLNGAILGMSKVEINRKFDTIVAFSEIEKFLDTPVKRYSSGMYVRLAFAVAAHLEPEILIVDEVLAVGDAAFQKKCLGKMHDVAANDGRTVLFVSHNLEAVTNLCSRAVWLDKGGVKADGGASETVEAYLKSNLADVNSQSKDWIHSGSGNAKILWVELFDAGHRPNLVFEMGAMVVLEFSVEFFSEFASVELGLLIRRASTGLAIYHLINKDCNFSVGEVKPGTRKFRVEMQQCLLYPGSYTLSIWVGSHKGEQLDWVEHILTFDMIKGNLSNRTAEFYNHLGTCYQPSVWAELSDHGTPTETSTVSRGRSMSANAG